MLIIEGRGGNRYKGSHFGKPVARNDREPGSGEKGLSIKSPLFSYSVLIKADKGRRIRYTEASVWRQRYI